MADRGQPTQSQSRLDELGTAHGGVVDAAYGSGPSFRDPYDIALEFAPPGRPAVALLGDPASAAYGRDVWLAAAVLGALAVLTGILPRSDAWDVTTRVGPVLAFLVAITVLAELADAAEVFDVAADRAARLAGGSTRRLFLLVCALGTVTTLVLSLDTTAVLLTPVVLTLALRLDLPPLPFAMAAVWLANTASLLLPVSNLTNLLALNRLHLSVPAYAARMALPAAVAVTGTVAVLGLRYRRDLRGRYALGARVRPADRTLFAVSALACVAIAPGVLAGVPPWTVALPAAGVAAVAFARRRPSVLRPGLLPWRLVLLTEALFLVVTAAGRHGLDRLLADAAGHSGSAVGIVRTAAVGAAASNAVNNLPSYLALERAVPPGATGQLLGLLVGTDVGPLVLMWGSLATLLWRQRCRDRGVTVSARELAVVGLVGMPPVLVATALAVRLTVG